VQLKPQLRSRRSTDYRSQPQSAAFQLPSSYSGPTVI